MALTETVFLAMAEDPLLLPVKEEDCQLSESDPYSMVQASFDVTAQSDLNLKTEESYPLAEQEGERDPPIEDLSVITTEAEPDCLPLQVVPLHVENPDTRLNSDLWIVPSPWDASEGWTDGSLCRSQRVNQQDDVRGDPEERGDAEQWIVPEQHDVLDGLEEAPSRAEEYTQLNGRAAQQSHYPVVRLMRLTQAELSAARFDHCSPRPFVVSGSRDRVVRFVLKSRLSPRPPARLQAVRTYSNSRTLRQVTSNQVPWRSRCQTPVRGPSRAVGTINNTEQNLQSILQSILSRPVSAEESYAALRRKEGAMLVPRLARLQTPASGLSKAVGTNNNSELDLLSQPSTSVEKNYTALHRKEGVTLVPRLARLQTPASGLSKAVGTNNNSELDLLSQPSTFAKESYTVLRRKEGVTLVPRLMRLQTPASYLSKAVGTNNKSGLDLISQPSTSAKESDVVTQVLCQARLQTPVSGLSKAVKTNNNSELDLLSQPSTSAKESDVVTQVPCQAKLQTPVSGLSKAMGTNNNLELDLRSQPSRSAKESSSALGRKETLRQMPWQVKVPTRRSGRSKETGISNVTELDGQSLPRTSAEESNTALRRKKNVMENPGQARLQTSMSDPSKAAGTSSELELDVQSHLGRSTPEGDPALGGLLSTSAEQCDKKLIPSAEEVAKQKSRRLRVETPVSGAPKSEVVINNTEPSLESLPSTGACAEESDTELGSPLNTWGEDSDMAWGSPLNTGGDESDSTSVSDTKCPEDGVTKVSKQIGVPTMRRKRIKRPKEGSNSAERKRSKVVPKEASMPKAEAAEKEGGDGSDSTSVSDTKCAEDGVKKVSKQIGVPITRRKRTKRPKEGSNSAKRKHSKIDPKEASMPKAEAAEKEGGGGSDLTSVSDTICAEDGIKKVSKQIGVPITRRKRTKKPKKDSNSAKRKRSKIVPEEALTPSAEAAEKEARHRAALDERRSNVVVIPAELEKSVDVHWSLVGTSRYSCNICSLRCATEVKMVCHVRQHLDVRPYGCKLCPATFCSRGTAVRHGQVHNKLYACGFCSHRFKQESMLRDHENLHKDLRPYQCKLCDANFHALGNLRTHVANIHEQVRERVMCEECGKSYGTVSLLNKHLCLNHKKQRVTCRVCHKELHITSLKTHMLIHTNPSFSCDVCSKSFVSRERLSRHIQTVHADGKLECPECGKKYKSKQFLEDHILIHRGIRRHCCPICGKTFSTRANYETHKFVHLGKNFVCHICGAKFNRNDNMKSHMKRVHTDGKNNEKERVVLVFKCSDCEKSFGTNKLLKDHLLMHDERYSTCDVCSKSYLSKKRLSNHIESAHLVRASL